MTVETLRGALTLPQAHDLWRSVLPLGHLPVHRLCLHGCPGPKGEGKGGATQRGPRGHLFFIPSFSNMCTSSGRCTVGLWTLEMTHMPAARSSRNCKYSSCRLLGARRSRIFSW